MLTRRQGLAAVALLGPVGFLAACSGSEEPDPATPTTLPATIATAVAAREQELVSLYDAIIAAFPDLAGPLQPIRDQHGQHAAALDPSSAASPSPTATEVPEDADQAIATLLRAERRAMRERIDACVEAEDVGLARTLAFVAASEGSHVPALRELRS